MSEAREQESGVKRAAEQGVACGAGVCATGHCAEGKCVRDALVRLVVVAAVLTVLAFVSGQMAWLAVAGMQLFSAIVLWALDGWSLARARFISRM